ncbi:MAG: DDE-type integrase/transposase/recombinase [Eubacteriales bacterium]|nr:DDE-type integrase/transposase/recombinase [Eubacteriales bacterium]
MKSKEIRNWRNDEAIKRYQMIAPLLDPDIDNEKRCQLREAIAVREGISARTIYRYEEKYRNGQFEGLLPMNRGKRRSQKLPENWDEIVGEAIMLKREVPKRSVRTIITILELEGWAPPGIIRRSTLQKYLYDAGFGVKQMKRTAERAESSSRRFCRPHRMELVQGDIKYGPDIRTKDGKLIHTYLSSLIDDHSRLILQSQFYDNQKAEIVEDTFHRALLKFGKWDSTYLDNGKQYISKQLHKSCARLGIRILHAKPYECQAKGKIEAFHKTADRFIAEIRAAHVHSLEELNEKWKYFLEEDYQKKPHEGIAEYYRSGDVEVPSCGISPQQEFNRDERQLKFIDVSVVSEAFTHHETRKIDNVGCFDFGGRKYEASAAYANLEVEIAYDPLNTETIEVHRGKMDVIHAHPLRIGSFADRKPVRPLAMTNEDPETSRLLDALEKKYRENHSMMANALSFGDYGKAGEQDV